MTRVPRWTTEDQSERATLPKEHCLTGCLLGESGAPGCLWGTCALPCQGLGHKLGARTPAWSSGSGGKQNWRTLLKRIHNILVRAAVQRLFGGCELRDQRPAPSEWRLPCGHLHQQPGSQYSSIEMSEWPTACGKSRGGGHSGNRQAVTRQPLEIKSSAASKLPGAHHGTP